MNHSFSSAQPALRGALCPNPTTSLFRFLVLFLGFVLVASFSSCELFEDETEDITGNYVMTEVDRSYPGINEDYESYSGDGILGIGECEQYSYTDGTGTQTYPICHTDESYLLLRDDNTFRVYWKILQDDLILIGADNVEGTYTFSGNLLTLTTINGTEQATIENEVITWGLLDESFKFTFEK